MRGIITSLNNSNISIIIFEVGSFVCVPPVNMEKNIYSTINTHTHMLLQLNPFQNSLKSASFINKKKKKSLISPQNILKHGSCISNQKNLWMCWGCGVEALIVVSLTPFSFESSFPVFFPFRLHDCGSNISHDTRQCYRSNQMPPLFVILSSYSSFSCLLHFVLHLLFLHLCGPSCPFFLFLFFMSQFSSFSHF